jgi:hypothetical protein
MKTRWSTAGTGRDSRAVKGVGLKIRWLRLRRFESCSRHLSREVSGSTFVGGEVSSLRRGSEVQGVRGAGFEPANR